MSENENKRRVITGIAVGGGEIEGFFHGFFNDADGDIVAIVEEKETGEVYYLFKNIKFIR